MDRKQYMKEYYQKNKDKFVSSWDRIKDDPEKRKQYNKWRSANKTARAAYRNTRQQILEHLGGKCVVCGTTENLEVNHLNLADTELRRKSKKNNNCRPGLNAIKNSEVQVELMCKEHHKQWSCAQRKAAMQLFASLSQEEQIELTKEHVDW